MTTIHRYQLDLTDRPHALMPAGARVLSAEVKPNDAYVSVWAIVDPTQPDEKREFRIAGTGHPLDVDAGWRFVSTLVLRGGLLCLHVFVKEMA